MTQHHYSGMIVKVVEPGDWIIDADGFKFQILEGQAVVNMNDDIIYMTPKVFEELKIAVPVKTEIKE